MKPYLDKTGYPMPLQMNPAEFVLDLVNTDFASHQESAETQLTRILANWESSDEASEVDAQIQKVANIAEKHKIHSGSLQGASAVTTVSILLHRSFIKSYRDVIAYGVRIIMYLGALSPCMLFRKHRPQILTCSPLGLAIMVGTVWLRLGSGQENIQPFINAVVRNIYLALSKPDRVEPY